MATSAHFSTAVALKLGYILITAGGTEETEETEETKEEEEYEKKTKKTKKKMETMKTRVAKTTKTKKKKTKRKTNMKSSIFARSIRVFLTVSSEKLLNYYYSQRHKVIS